MKSFSDYSIITNNEIIESLGKLFNDMPQEHFQQVLIIRKQRIKWITILHTVLSVTILLLGIVSICYYFIKHRLKHQLKQMMYYHINNIKMESNNKLKKINIKNHTYYYFVDINNINDLDLDNVLLNEKSCKTFLIYVAYKTRYGVKLLYIIFEKVDGYIRKFDGTKYLAFFHSNEKYKRIFAKLRYLIMLKNNISDVYYHKYAKIKFNSDDDLNIKYE